MFTLAAWKNQAAEILFEKLPLLATPAKCVALHQGRKCFANVVIKWKVQQTGNYCLYQKSTKEKLHCWQNSDASSFVYEFESTETITFQLIEEKNSNIYAETAVEVSWVHKSTPRKRRWRLF